MVSKFEKDSYHMVTNDAKNQFTSRVSTFGGMEWWNGMVEWNSGMDYWNGGMLHRTYLIGACTFRPLRF